MTDQTDQTEDEPMRTFTRALFAPDPDAALFGKAEPDEPVPPDPAMANHVPAEGNNPATHADPEDMREFVHNLFFPPLD